MKNLILLFVIGIGAYFFMQSPYKTDFIFADDIYSYADKKKRGVITNYFYTLKGQELKSARKIIRILETDDSIPKDERSDIFSHIFKNESMKPFRGTNTREYTGTSKQGIYSVRSYAAPIIINDVEHMIFYTHISTKPLGTESGASKMKVLNQLKNIRLL